METLTQKEKGLISTGASVAAGCQPCTAYHVNAALETGASEDEIRKAVELALMVRNEATSIMAGVASEHLGGNQPLEIQLTFSDYILDELIAVAAAFAVSCKTGLAHHMQAALDAGASERQILITLRLSRGIKSTADNQVVSILHMGDAYTLRENVSGCGCQQTEAVGNTGCGCG